MCWVALCRLNNNQYFINWHLGGLWVQGWLLLTVEEGLIGGGIVSWGFLAPLWSLLLLGSALLLWPCLLSLFCSLLPLASWFLGLLGGLGFGLLGWLLGLGWFFCGWDWCRSLFSGLFLDLFCSLSCLNRFILWLFSCFFNNLSLLVLILLGPFRLLALGLCWYFFLNGNNLFWWFLLFGLSLSLTSKGLERLLKLLFDFLFDRLQRCWWLLVCLLVGFLAWFLFGLLLLLLFGSLFLGLLLFYNSCCYLSLWRRLLTLAALLWLLLLNRLLLLRLWNRLLFNSFCDFSLLALGLLLLALFLALLLLLLLLLCGLLFGSDPALLFQSESLLFFLLLSFSFGLFQSLSLGLLEGLVGLENSRSVFRDGQAEYLFDVFGVEAQVLLHELFELLGLQCWELVVGESFNLRDSEK